MAPTLSDFKDPEREYQRVCALANQYKQMHEHTAAKNERIRSLISKNRRAVACMNACEGIRTEALEYRAHLLKSEDYELTLMRKEMDVLVDVINHIVNEVKLTSSQYELCRQAIASAKGESK